MIRAKMFPSLLMLSLGLMTTALSVEAKDAVKLDNRIYSCDYVVKEHKNIGVILVLGDSNIAASDVPAQEVSQAVFNVNPVNGLCYPAHEPLMGTVARAGSPWVRLANLLVEKKVYEDVLLIPVILPESSIAEWKKDGRVFTRLQNTLNTLPKQNIVINAVLWQHGQKNDASLTSKEDYIAGFSDVVAVLRNGGVTAPVFVARTGDCPGKAAGFVWEAQAALPGLGENVLAGPDLSTFGSDSFDAPNCALNQKGLDAYVAGWLEALMKK